MFREFFEDALRILGGCLEKHHRQHHEHHHHALNAAKELEHVEDAKALNTAKELINQ